MIIDNLLLSSLCLETKDSTTNIKTTSILRIKTTSLEHTTETKTMNTTTTFATIAPTSTSITMQPGIDSVRYSIAFHNHKYKIVSNVQVDNTELFYLDTEESCKDMDDGVFDGAGDSCSWYNHNLTRKYCGKYDDEDFSASALCCACKGIIINYGPFQTKAK